MEGISYRKEIATVKEQCTKFQADLTDYARGEYKYIKDFDALFNHLRECESCRNKFFELEEIFKALRPPYEPSPEFTKRMNELKEMFKKGPPSVTQERKDERTEKLKKGIELYKKQKWFEAAKVFDELVNQLQRNEIQIPPAPLNKGGKEGGISPFDKGGERGILADAYYHRGLAHQRMNLLDEAIADFTKAIELDKDDADAYFHRAQIYYNNLEWDKTLSDLNRAIRLNPDYSEAYYGLGMINEQIGEWEKAIDDFSAVIEREPNNALAYFHRGINRTRNKSNASAREDFKKAIELIPDEPAGYLNMGITYAIEGNLKEAINWFKQSLKINPKYQEAKDVIKMAQAQIKAEDVAKSAEHRAKKEKRIKSPSVPLYKRGKQGDLKKGSQSRKASGLMKYQMRIKELEAENKTLKEFQKQLLDLIAQQRPDYTNQLQSKTLPQDIGGLNAFLKIPAEGQSVSPKNIKFPIKS